ncbi:TonB-linked outer membrane protein, SusC/RagA family [Mucilaginibacter gossypiicola]|uniref:TonB-linked outer membrane protein, SusC/RagA family n=1 Tax=Mucilaginibacter gossypiicola TaxID=551995 RepID=A0A1H8I2B5_9SPHI|nr:TonB-dependent receptor [Mucilaginibacter gossypiicola]SEN62265.1 TonB-linked outer membrane protein, SusC/RagA family [Mucilaginibacter gossypiicola]
MKPNLLEKDSPHRKRSPRFFVVAASMAVACFATVQMPVMAFAGTVNEQRLPDARISGKVTDEKGETLPGVSVSLKGTSTGVVTDINGKFSLNVPNASSGTLVFSYIGYTSQEVALNGQTTINVQLTADSKSLNEVVVVGYGTQKKATLTGSISQVKGAELVKSPQPNLSNSIAGRFSGVIVNNRSGEPGYDGSNITVRGLATTGSNNVLIVVDGIPGQIGGLERLDPNDIESMSVLKDASAAIYGNRAANGVILITTKRGKTGKPTINYSFNQGFASPTRLPKMADAATYAQIMNEINLDSNPNGGPNQAYTADQIQKFKDGSDPLLYPNTDWEKQTLKGTALQNQHSLSVNGGSEDVKYFVSLGTLYQDGIYKSGVTKYHQYNFRSNIDANVTKRLKVGLSLSGRQEDRQFPVTGAGDLFRSVYRAKPIVAAYYPNGDPTTGIENNNPAVQVTDLGGTNNNPTQVFNGILRGSYSIPGIEGLSLDGFFSVDKSNAFDKNFSKPYNLYSYSAATQVYTPVVVGGNNNKAMLFESQNNQSLITSNIKLNFVRKFGLHDINAFVGYEQSKNHLEYFDATRYNYLSSQLPELSQGGGAATDYLNSGYSSNYNRRSVISRLAYAYDEKYLFEGQFRADGSSIFPPGKQWGYFPSASVGWRISKEDWFKNSVNFFDDLKIRASYGSLGNDNVNGFQYFDNYVLVNNGFVATAPGNGSNTAQPNVNLVKLANPNITWEVAKKLDIGINATILHNFTVEAIYFQQKRSDILTNRSASLPGSSGIVNPYNDGSSTYTPLVPSENIGKVDSKGFEATLGYNHTGREFSWGVSGNITYAKSKIIFIDEASGTLSYQRQTGLPLGTSLLYDAIGIFRTQADLDAYPHVTGAKVGDLKYLDYNNDGKITADDQTRTKYGNIPQITYGFSVNAAYKGFDLSVLFAGQAQVSQYVLPEAGSVGNFYSSWADNRFSASNTNGTYPRVTDRASNAISGGLYNNTFWLNDASFLRLKNVQLGYNFNAPFLSKIKLGGLRVYASAFNLFTITKVKDYDPEGTSGSGQFYPQQRIINLGVNVKF